jgi:glucose/arabinose dehydrogenase
VGVRRAAACTAAALAAAAVCASPAAAAVQLVKIGDFSSPIFVAAPPGDGARLFVVERAGRIQLVHDGVRRQFLDISTTVRTDGERGLLSMAFAPDYAASGLFYVFDVEAATGDVKIEEFRRSATDPDVADPASRREVMREPHSASNHNGGQLQFGPDGYLYATIGDNATSSNAQALTNVYGKVLRIDPRAGQPLVPADNPWAGQAPKRGEIWSLGLRNPWRFSFDRQTADLVIADVGAGSWEEVDWAPRGAGGGRALNFGWPTCEGFCTSPQPAFTEPVLVHDHTSFCAITGGYVTRTDDLPSLAGRYVYGDYCDDTLRSATLLQPQVTDDRAESLAVPALVSFGEDACGHLFAVSANGPVYRLSEQSPPPACTLVPEPAAQQPPAQEPPADQPPAAGPGATADTTAPRIAARFRRRQRSARTRRVALAVRCDEPCRIAASGALLGTGARRRPRLAGAAADASASRRLVLRLSARTARLARRAIARDRRVTARVRLTAADAAGNRAKSLVARIRIVG